MIKIIKVVNEKTYYPEKTRKSKIRRYFENVYWVLFKFEINYNYNSYGLDVKKFRKLRDFMPYEKVKYLRDFNNKYSIKHDYNYIAILRDKYVFSLYFREVLGDACLKSIAYLNEGVIIGCNLSIKEIVEKHQNIVMKKVDGELGENIYFIDLKEDTLLVNGTKSNYQELNDIISNSKYIIQEVLKQHSGMTLLNSNSVNTIRIITIIKGNKIYILSAFVRIGNSIDKKVDNRSAGGIGVGINKNGKLEKWGFVHSKYGTKFLSHPITKVVFEGWEIPYWDQVIEIAIKAHESIKSVKSIGWDVAITNKGPVIIEGNDNWEIGGPQDTHGGLKKAFNVLMDGK